MTIVEESSDRLVLRKFPTVSVAILALMLGSLIVGLSVKTADVFAGRGDERLSELGLIWLGLIAVVVVAALFMSVITVVFDRPAGKVVVRRAQLTGRSEQVVQLADLTTGEIESYRDDDGDDMYRLALVLHNGNRVPLTLVHESWVGNKRPALAAIQRFLGVGLPQAV